MGSAEEALAAHERTVEFLQRSTATGNAEQQRQLAVARNNLAVALRRSGQTKRAVEQLQLAKEAQLALEPALHPELARELATTYVNLGLAHQDAGFRAGAEDSFHNAITQLTSARKSGEQVAETSRPLAAAYQHLARVHQAHETQLALGLYQQAISLLEQTNLVHSTDHRLANELVGAYHGQALLLTRTKQYRLASAAFARAVELQRQLVEQAPGDANLHSDLGCMLSNFGVAQAGAGDDVAAATSLQQAIAQQRWAQQLAPDSRRFRDLLARHDKLLATYQQQLAAKSLISAQETQP